MRGVHGSEIMSQDIKHITTSAAEILLITIAIVALIMIFASLL